MMERSSSSEGELSDEPRDVCTGKKYSRENTSEEKRRMNKLRRKRKRCKKKMKTKLQQLKREVSSEIELRKQAERSVTTYRQISRTYWERWRWELHKRREAMQEIVTRNRFTSVKSSEKCLIHEIDPSMLKDPVVDGKFKEVYLARGCFGIVRLQQYRGMQVAVKEFLPRTLAADVKVEASVLASLSHPYVPFLFGVCTKKLPLRIIMQYHTVNGHDVSTLERELHKGQFLGSVWIILCAQLMEVMHYLHEEVGILHNDIKGDNVLLARALKPEVDCLYQIVLIDFGKATKISDSKRYHLTAIEKCEYIRKYPHIPPEVIEGVCRQSKSSDIYAIGRLLYQISDSGCINSLEGYQKVKFREFAQRCRRTDFSSRPKSKECLDFFEQL